MAAHETTRPAPFGAIIVLRVTTAVERGIAALAAWNDARMTRNALGQLSDRELDDIGLSRSDIETVARAR
jgi:uncharacterized protein YjiS (DUF1127 family)